MASGQKKIGRNKLKCQRYRNEERTLKNQRKRLDRHLKAHGNDRQAVHARANIRISAANGG